MTDRKIERLRAWNAYRNAALFDEPKENIELAREVFTAGWDAAIDTVKSDIDKFLNEQPKKETKQ